MSDADDAVQETWLRLSRSGADEVENPGGWLTTIVARVSPNMLRLRTSRREEPIFSPATGSLVAGPVDRTDPEHEAVLADSVGRVLLVVLDTLTSAERLAFVRHDMFAVPFEEIAPMVERSPAAARQLASRAGRRVQQNGPESPIDREDATSRQETGAPRLSAEVPGSGKWRPPSSSMRCRTRAIACTTSWDACFAAALNSRG